MPSRNRGAQDPRWQRWLPQPKPLASVGVATLSTNTACPFSVPVPDSRLRVKVSLLFATSTPFLTVPAATLWLYEADDNDYGLQNGEVPLVNLVGSKAAPTPIPLAGDVNLYGWSREFVTAADYINGILTPSGNGAAIGTWVLQCRYQPNAVRLTDDEWDMVTAQCSPRGTLQNIL